MAKRIQGPDDDKYFVAVKNPLELRRQILECSRKTLYSMQNYHKALLIREQKIREFARLKQNIKELIYLNKNFNARLPPFDHELLHENKKISKQAKAALKIVTGKKPENNVVPQERSELERLEQSLNAIEEKLKVLNPQKQE